jgi:nicotinate-nucleotide adenylyltransferase
VTDPLDAAVRIGVMGGSFDPIHHGHLVAASEAAHRFGLSRVIFCPTGQAWHKSSHRRAPAEVRYLMTVVATAADPRFEVSRVDIDRPGPTYTIDTLRDLRRERSAAGEPDAQWYFITGADALAEILGWRDPQAVVAAAHLVGVTRPGHVLADPGLPQARVSLLEVPALAISSTDIRQRAARGEPISYLVPDGVAHLIAKHGLYRGPSDDG